VAAGNHQRPVGARDRVVGDIRGSCQTERFGKDNQDRIVSHTRSSDQRGRNLIGVYGEDRIAADRRVANAIGDVNRHALEDRAVVAQGSCRNRVDSISGAGYGDVTLIPLKSRPRISACLHRESGRLQLADCYVGGLIGNGRSDGSRVEFLQTEAG